MKLSMNDNHKEDEPIDITRKSKHKRNNFKAKIKIENWHLKQNKNKKRKLFRDKGKSNNDRRKGREIYTCKSDRIVRVRVRMMERNPSFKMMIGCDSVMREEIFSSFLSQKEWFLFSLDTKILFFQMVGLPFLQSKNS